MFRRLFSLNIITWNVENCINARKSGLNAKEMTSIQTENLIRLAGTCDVVLIQEMTLNLKSSLEEEMIVNSFLKLYSANYGNSGSLRPGVGVIINTKSVELLGVSYIDIMQQLWKNKSVLEKSRNMCSVLKEVQNTNFVVIKVKVKKLETIASIYNWHLPLKMSQCLREIVYSFTNVMIGKSGSDLHVLGGDFNADFTNAGTVYLTGDEEHEYSKPILRMKCLMPQGPTCNNQEDFEGCIDYFVTDSTDEGFKCWVQQGETYSKDNPSDHLPVFLCLNVKKLSF